jgi:hypothetical protein
MATYVASWNNVHDLVFRGHDLGIDAVAVVIDLQQQHLVVAFIGAEGVPLVIAEQRVRHPGRGLGRIGETDLYQGVLAASEEAGLVEGCGAVGDVGEGLFLGEGEAFPLAVGTVVDRATGQPRSERFGRYGLVFYLRTCN